MPARMTESGNHRKNLQKIGLGLGSPQIGGKRADDRLTMGKDRGLKPFQLFDAHRGRRSAKRDRGFALGSKCGLDHKLCSCG